MITCLGFLIFLVSLIALIVFIILKYTGFTIGGWIAPIVFWIMGKENSILVNRQGKYILNWYISWFLYGIALTVLFVIFMFSGILSISDMDYANDQTSPLAVLLGIFGGGAGILLLLILGIGCFLCLLFPIIGGIKGLNGKTWKYPLSIPFLK